MGILCLTGMLLLQFAMGDLGITCKKPQAAAVWNIHIQNEKVSEGKECVGQSHSESTSSYETLTVLLHPTGKKRLVSALVSPALGLPYSGEVLHGRRSRVDWGSIHTEGLIIETNRRQESRVLYGHFGLEGTKSLCHVIPHGWVLTRNADGSRSISCFSAERMDGMTPVQNSVFVGNPVGSSGDSSVPSTFLIPNWQLDASVGAQGSKCGSCFVYSFAYAFERVIGNYFKRTTGGSTADIILDREAMLACSYSNQGCDGGFYSSLSLDSMLTGIPETRNCFGKISSVFSSSASGHAGRCPKDVCYDNQEDKLFYPSGFEELRSVDSIQKFIMSVGPVLTSVMLSRENTLGRSPAQATDWSTMGVTEIPDWDATADDYDDVNHGLVLIGWGRDEERKIDFWDVYNPWGGFGRIPLNNGVVERNGVGILLDTTRGATAMGKKSGQSDDPGHDSSSISQTLQQPIQLHNMMP